MSEPKKVPEATIVAFVYDERPTMNLVRPLLRDARRLPQLNIWDQSRDALISRARSAAASRFMEQGGGDVLVMLDHDIGWELGDLDHLIIACEMTRGVVGGIYPMRTFGRGSAVRFDEPGEFRVGGNDQLVQCSVIGTGFMAIHRDVLRRLDETLPLTIHGFRPYFACDVVQNDAAGGLEYLSEDYAFCKRVRDAGGAIYADLMPTLTHSGSHDYRMIDTAVRLPEDQSVVLRMVSPDTPHDIGNGRTLVVDVEDHVVSNAISRGEAWEPEVLAVLALYRDRGWRLLDAGAHIGYVAIAAADWFEHVYAVEPLPHLAELLRRNVTANGLDARITVWEMALRDRFGKARMLRDYRNAGASFVLPDGETSGIEVETMPADFDPPAEIWKLDLEGSEYPAIFGSVFLDAVKVIVFEYCDAQLRRSSGVPGPRLLRRLRDEGFSIRYAADPFRELDDATLPSGHSYVNLVAVRPAYAPTGLDVG